MSNSISNWNNRGIVLVSRSENMYLVIRELVKIYKWNTTAVTASPKQAVDYVKKNTASMIVIDDTPDNPSPSVIREIMSTPLGCTIPILCLLMDKNEHAAPAISRLGKISVAPKPITRASFAPMFTRLVSSWESKPLFALRKVVDKVKTAPNPIKIMALERLKGIKQIESLVTRAKALILLEEGRNKEAEKECLDILLFNPSDLGLIITIGDIYMRSAMPEVAFKIFNSAATRFPNNVLILPDLVQAALFSHRETEALEFLKKQYNMEYMPEKNMTMLGRILFAEGRFDEAALVLGDNRNWYKKIEQSWRRALGQDEKKESA